jgi:hypothetical protein
MATSGSVDFAINRDEIIKRALRLLGVLPFNETPSADQSEDASDVLNMMIKSWQGIGYNLWRYQEATLFPTEGTNEYTLSSTGANVTASYVSTETSAAASSGASTIDVDSITGISSGDNIGVFLDGGTFQWTTVNGAPSGSTITLTDTLTDDVSVDATVYAYTTKINRPLKVMNARRVISSIETEMYPMSYFEYQNQPQKTTQATPVAYMYDRKLASKLHLWPAPDDDTVLIKLTLSRELEDFDAQANTMDFPDEWYDAVCYGLAVRLAPEYGINVQTFQVLKQESEQYLQSVLAWDRDDEGVCFQPDFRR